MSINLQICLERGFKMWYNRKKYIGGNLYE